jgi:hypothetical protein
MGSNEHNNNNTTTTVASGGEVVGKSQRERRDTEAKFAVKH